MLVGIQGYLVALLLTGAILVAVGAYAWWHRDLPGATPLVFTMFAVLFCTVCTAFELSGDNLQFKLFWANIVYLGYVSVPVAWLMVVLQYTGRAGLINRRRLAAMLVIPALTVILTFTNELHGLMRYNVYLDTDGPFSVVGKSYGPWFWVHASYSYVLLMVAVVLLSGAVARSIAPYRAQAVALLAATLLPLVWNVVYVFGMSPFQRTDISLIIYSISGCIIAWALFRHRLFALAPVMLDKVIDVVRDAVVVLDAERRVTALNPAARALLEMRGADVLGADGASLFAPWPALATMVGADEATEAEVAFEGEGRHRVFDVHSSPLGDCPSGQPCGQVLVLRDVTDHRRAEEALRESERRYRELADALPQPVFEADGKGFLTFANRSAFETFGYSSEDAATGLNVMQVLSPDERARGMGSFARVMHGGASGGEYQLQRKDGTTFPAIIYSSPMISLGRVVGLRGIIVDITGRKRQEEQLAFLAAHDPLTGVPNRRALEHAVKRALDAAAAEGTPGALLFIDLDNFKCVNDRLGHLAGDAVLVRIVREWRALLRSDDLLARYGGDEFAVLLPGSDREVALHVAERLREAVERFDHGDGGPALDLGLSVGLVTLDGQLSLDEVLAQGDAAMYHAKELGGHRVVVHRPWPAPFPDPAVAQAFPEPL